ncbi:MAG: HAMP domain-containing protein [Candidatus Binatia bacterium]
MAQESVSLEAGTLSLPSPLRRQRISLGRKIAGALLAIVVLLGLLVVFIVYRFTGSALRSQLDQQASVIATNFGDAASGLIIGNRPLELHALIAKYARLEGVAYVFIDDARGEILASGAGVLASELGPISAVEDRRRGGKRFLTFRGRPVVETRAPILEGQAGAARVGMWGDVAENQIRQVLLPILGLIGVAIVGAVVLSSLLAHWIVKPILGLIAVANRISKGDLETPVTVDAHDEIGELARSLERMRLSLKAAMARLSP